MSDRKFKCPCCGQMVTFTDIEHPNDWKDTKEKIRVHGSYTTTNIAGEIRVVDIGDKQVRFLRNEIREFWPALERLVQREDDSPY